MSTNPITEQPSRQENVDRIPIRTFAGEASRASLQGIEDEENWMQPPTLNSQYENCPDGLNYLAALDEIYVEEKPREKMYHILNKEGKFVYVAVDTTNSQLRPSEYPSEIYIVHKDYNREVLLFNSPIDTIITRCACCCPQNETKQITVRSPTGGGELGINSVTNFWSPTIAVKNNNNEKLFKIEGPALNYCGCDNTFKIYKSEDGKPVGEISTVNASCERFVCCNQSQFHIVFDKNLTPIDKALILAAGFLIDQMFFDLH